MTTRTKGIAGGVSENWCCDGREIGLRHIWTFIFWVARRWAVQIKNGPGLLIVVFGVRKGIHWILCKVKSREFDWLLGRELRGRLQVTISSLSFAACKIFTE